MRFVFVDRETIFVFFPPKLWLKTSKTFFDVYLKMALKLLQKKIIKNKNKKLKFKFRNRKKNHFYLKLQL